MSPTKTLFRRSGVAPVTVPDTWLRPKEKSSVPLSALNGVDPLV